MDITTERLMMTAGGKESYWIESIVANNLTTYGFGIGVDSSKNIYISGQGNFGDSCVFSAKLTSGGAIIWAKFFDYNGTGEYSSDLVIDSSNNLYISANYRHSAHGVTGLGIAKCNSNTGDFTTVKSWNYSPGTTQPAGCGISSSGTVLTVGYTYAAPAYYAAYLAVDSSLNFVFGKNVLFSLTSPDYQFANDASGDSSGNFLTVSTAFNGSYYVPVVHKINSSGSTIWGRIIQINDFSGPFISVDSSDNSLVSGQASVYQSYNYADCILFKLDSSNGFVWGRRLFITGTNSLFRGTTTDSSGNIYAVGSYNTSGYSKGFIVKFDSNGNVLWQRYLDFYTSSLALTLYRVCMYDNDTICVTGYVATSPVGALVLKLPADGSLTGTYGNYIYGVATLSVSGIFPSTAGPFFTEALTLDYNNASGSTVTPTTTSTLTTL